MKNSSSESVVGARKGLESEGCCGSVFECLNTGFGVVVRSLGRPPSPHVSCRRRGLEDDPGTRGELVTLDGVLSTANEYLLATMTLGPTLCTHSLVLGKESQPQFS